METGETLNSENDENKQKSSKHEAPEEKKTEKARVVVSVKEISCTVCAQAIEKQVKKINGIEDVRTAIMLNKVFIDYDPKLVDSSAIRKAIDKTGFKSYMAVEENH
jgi:copper chaperone CopZ